MIFFIPGDNAFLQFQDQRSGIYFKPVKIEINRALKISHHPLKVKRKGKGEGL